jgi:hypothetical protein
LAFSSRSRWFSGAQRFQPLAQRRFAGALPRRDGAGFGAPPVAQRLDLAAQRGLGVEPLARDAGAASDDLEADLRALGVEVAQRLLGALDGAPVAGSSCLVQRLSGHRRPGGLRGRR